MIHPPTTPTTTVADLAEQWVTARLARGEISATTAKGHRSHLRRLAERAHGRGLDAVTVDDYVRSTAHLAPSTRRLRYSTAAAFLGWAHGVGAVAVDLTGMLPTVRVPRAVPRSLPPETSRRILAACTDTRARLIVTLMLQLGLRCAEVARITMVDISPGADSLLVHGKGGHERLLPITTEARAVLVEYLADHPEATTGPLVRSHHNYRRGVSADLVSRIVGDAMRTADVKLVRGDGVSAHALRHSFATDLIHHGAPLPIIQRARPRQLADHGQIRRRHTARATRPPRRPPLRSPTGEPHHDR